METTFRSNPADFLPPFGIMMGGEVFKHVIEDCQQMLDGISRRKLRQYGFANLRLMAEDAPNTFEEVAQAMIVRQYGDEFPIYHGHCEQTILHKNCSNTWYRAWHDIVHVEVAGAFTLPGEKVVVKQQLTEMAVHGATPHHQEVVWYDIMGQLLHNEKYSEFPVRQREFVEACCRKGLRYALSFKW